MQSEHTRIILPFYHSVIILRVVPAVVVLVISLVCASLIPRAAVGQPIRVAGNALQFDGIDDYVLSPDVFRFFSNETVSIEVWFKPTRGGLILVEYNTGP